MLMVLYLFVVLSGDLKRAQRSCIIMLRIKGKRKHWKIIGLIRMLMLFYLFVVLWGDLKELKEVVLSGSVMEGKKSY